MGEAQRRAALLVPPGEDPYRWMHRQAAIADAYELVIVALPGTWGDLMRILWCTGGADVGVVGARTELDESRLIVAEEARQPPAPIPGQRRPRWAPRLGS